MPAYAAWPDTGPLKLEHSLGMTVMAQWTKYMKVAAQAVY